MKNFGAQITEITESEHDGGFDDPVALRILGDESPTVAEQEADGQGPGCNNEEREDAIDDVDRYDVFLPDLNVTLKHFEQNLAKIVFRSIKSREKVRCQRKLFHR